MYLLVILMTIQMCIRVPFVENVNFLKALDCNKK